MPCAENAHGALPFGCYFIADRITAPTIGAPRIQSQISIGDMLSTPINANVPTPSELTSIDRHDDVGELWSQTSAGSDQRTLAMDQKVACRVTGTRYFIRIVNLPSRTMLPSGDSDVKGKSMAVELHSDPAHGASALRVRRDALPPRNRSTPG